MLATTEEIASADQNTILEIAIDFWPHYYPSGIQSLVTQLFGWNSPGTKYTLESIVHWLESQEQLVHDRIWQLIGIHPGDATISIIEEPAPQKIPPTEIIGKQAILSGQKPWEKTADDYFVGKKVVAVGEDCDGNYLVRLADDDSLEPCLYRTTRKWLVVISPLQSELLDRMELAQSHEELLHLTVDETVKGLLKLVNYKIRNKFASAIEPQPTLIHTPTKPTVKRKQRAA